MGPKKLTKNSGGNIEPLNSEKETEDKKPAKNFVLTIYLEKDDPPKYDPKKLQFLAYGSEICPTTGRHHWQTFCGFHSEKQFGAMIKFVLKWLGKSAYFKPMRGSIYENVDYCSKESELVKFGTFPYQGQRNDLGFLRDQLMSGDMSVEDIMLENPMAYHKYGRTLEKIEDVFTNRQWRTERTKGKWLWGPTGTGKSHAFLSSYNPKDIYIWGEDNGWWDGYRQQQVVVIQEFRTGRCTLAFLLELVDEYAMFVKRRNRTPIPFTSKMICITSPKHPHEYFDFEYGKAIGERADQLDRRFEIKEMKTKYVAPLQPAVGVEV